jgi:uncharacterized protein
MTQFPILQNENPWFAKGLRFTCTGCGQCCTGFPGYVWVTVEEIAAMAQVLNLSIEEFSRAYVRKIGDRYSLQEHPVTFDCVFLKDKKCQIYSARPKQCRTFPWWVQNLKSEEEWLSAAKHCEGINHPDAPVIDCKTILDQLS